MSTSDLAGTGASARAAFNPGPSVPVMIAGNEDDVVVIAAMLCTLDEHTRGRVFLEVGTQAEVMHLPAPGRVVVTWLVRDDDRRSAAPGELLDRATSAWLTEMLPLDGVTDSRVYTWQSGRSELLVC